jgi:hypothetical protein
MAFCAFVIARWRVAGAGSVVKELAEKAEVPAGCRAG